MNAFRVRFAPSPTGALHIGGVRTALYNYLLARKNGGSFILRVEDTDQARYIEGAESYIREALLWCGLEPDEGPGFGGDFGPYRQSERKDIYRQYAEDLVGAGAAYYAFDSQEELEAAREAARARGDHNFRYDSRVRDRMKNSLALPDEEVRQRLESGEPYTIRLLVPAEGEVAFEDAVRGVVRFQCPELDDKVMLKADGMPTYHLANVVDDHLMQVTHVIRGEEWLPSTAHHVLLYRFLGWENEMPSFAHLPLILKPTGNGKLSKRDGAKFGIPVFPLHWEAGEDKFVGFRETGFLPEAVINFLAFLGWNPGTEQEIFSLEELVEAFGMEHIGKSGARFDYDKALWFNQQYISSLSGEALAARVGPILESQGLKPDPDYLAEVCDLMKARMTLLGDLWEQGSFFFRPVQAYDDANAAKRWSPGRRAEMEKLDSLLKDVDPYEAPALEQTTKGFIKEENLKFGQIFPLLRIALAGSMQGPDVFRMMALLGKAEVHQRMQRAFDHFDSLA